MQIPAQLDQIRAEHSACSILAYADIGAGMILAKSADDVLAQERWDGLCLTAKELLAGAPGVEGAKALDATADDITYAIVIEAAEVGLFVRSNLNPDDACCCVCAPDVRIAPLKLALSDLLRSIDGAE